MLFDLSSLIGRKISGEKFLSIFHLESMEGRQRLVILVLLLLLSRTVSQPSLTNVTRPRHPKSQHRLSGWWPLLSSIGILGTIFNSYVLYCFISERNNMVTSVNVMIG